MGKRKKPSPAEEDEPLVFEHLGPSIKTVSKLLAAYDESGILPAKQVMSSPGWTLVRKHDCERKARLEALIEAVSKDRVESSTRVISMSLREFLRAVKTLSPPDDGWPTQAEVAKGLGTYPMEVNRLVKADKLRTNRLTGKECRIDPASILEYCAATGTAWNET
jgi:hypothetical protein